MAGDRATKLAPLLIPSQRHLVTRFGYGNVMFVAGAGVRGGQYCGSRPGLTDSLDADLLVTTDYRSVLTEVVTRRFGVSVGQVFPGFAPTTVGVMA